MATNQMEEGLLLKARDKAIGAIIERFPHNDLYIEGDDIILCVNVTEKPARELMFEGYGRIHGRGYIDNQPYTWIATCEEGRS